MCVWDVHVCEILYVGVRREEEGGRRRKREEEGGRGRKRKGQLIVNKIPSTFIFIV